jgi:hypothetical protein
MHLLDCLFTDGPVPLFHSLATPGSGPFIKFDSQVFIHDFLEEINEELAERGQ